MSGSPLLSPATPAFDLPAERLATEPPEARGLARDEVRLLVAERDRIHHTRFHALGEHLRGGDLLVVNTSATLPAALDGRRQDGRRVVVHVAGPSPDHDGSTIVELRRLDGHGPVRDVTPGEVVALPGGAELAVLAPIRSDGPPRLWRAALPLETSVERFLARHGRPVRYGYLAGEWPLEAYQTVFAREPGSAEMASAGRPFTPALVTHLVSRGVAIAPLRLHTSVSSFEADEAPLPERYHVPDATARQVARTRRDGGRVVAVGTTVTRALESVTRPDGRVEGGRGWTDLVLGPDRPARVVNGLVTGWHEADSSHLRLLEAVAGHRLVRRAYAAALEGGYLWHEFGDSCLLLP